MRLYSSSNVSVMEYNDCSMLRNELAQYFASNVRDVSPSVKRNFKFKFFQILQFKKFGDINEISFSLISSTRLLLFL
jgi:hypothetical protein